MRAAKAAMARLLVLLGATLLAACSAQPAEGADRLDGRVRDFAGILDPEAEARLTERLDEAERLYGPQVGIVTVVSLDGQSIEQFTRNYGNAWGLGDADRDDGIIILVAPNDRSAQIGIGLGIERDYPVAWAREVMDTGMLPHFREGNYGSGIEAAVEMIVARMKLFPTAPTNDNSAAAVDEAA